MIHKPIKLAKGLGWNILFKIIRYYQTWLLGIGAHQPSSFGTLISSLCSSFVLNTLIKSLQII